MQKMTSRERVRKAINHQEPDRMPIDFGGTKVTGIHVDEYLAIGEYLGLDLELPKVYETFQMLARVEGPILNWLHSDVIQIENAVESWGYENKNWKPWTTTTGNRVLVPGQFQTEVDAGGMIRLIGANGNEVAAMAPTGLYFDKTCGSEISEDISLMDPQVWKDSIPLYTESELRQLERRAKFFHDNTEYSIHGGFLKGKLGSSADFAGHSFVEWLCVLVTEEEYAYSILQATAERAVENLKLYFQAVGAYIDTILISSTDFGSQRGEIFNPNTFRNIYTPNYKRINDYVHENSQVKTMFHSCGSVRNIIPEFIKAGVDILNPIQFNTQGMEPQELKTEFGDELVFWGGGIDTQTVLPYGTNEEIINQIKTNMRILGSGGGAVFTPVHNLQYGVAPEKVELMVETVLKYGGYPLNAAD